MDYRTMSLEQILKNGEELYFERFRDELETKHFGEYAVIDVETEAYTTNQSKLGAIEEAQEKFGDKLFYIVKVGELDGPTFNFRNHVQPSWSF